MSTAQATSNKATFRRLHDAVNSRDVELISKMDHVTIEDLIAEGDKVACRNVVTGTHRGEYMGIPPTGKSVTYSEMFVFRFEGGRIAEARGVVDVLSQMRQLGAITEVSPSG